MSVKEDPKYCPVMNMQCPQGEEKAQECRIRYQENFDPIRNIRDFDILCCSYIRTKEVDDTTPVL
jgi:hypothetical protein